MGLVFDSSENMGEENFENLRSFLTPFLNVFNVGMRSTRVSCLHLLVSFHKQIKNNTSKLYQSFSLHLKSVLSTV